MKTRMQKTKLCQITSCSLSLPKSPNPCFLLLAVMLPLLLSSNPLAYIIKIAFCQFPMCRSFKNTFLGCKVDLVTSYLRIQQQLSMTSFSDGLFLSCFFISSSSTLLTGRFAVEQRARGEEEGRWTRAAATCS